MATHSPARTGEPAATGFFDEHLMQRAAFEHVALADIDSQPL